jgi:hypothetical protein
VTEPTFYTQTRRGEAPFPAAKGPMYEDTCREGNYGLHDILAAARRLEGKAVEGSPKGR